MSEERSFSFPIPGLSRQEDRVLRQIVEWTDKYLSTKSNYKYLEPPTTKLCSQHFKSSHEDMLALLNRLERGGFVLKERRNSGGISGNGYDGALHSKVSPTQKTRELLVRYP